MSDRQMLILKAAVRMIAKKGVRGLRVEELAAEAGVSTALIYYHFGDRAGLLRRTLEYVSERAERYTAEAMERSDDARTQLTDMLLLELQDDPAIIENSSAWGELRASAIFDPDLRAQLGDSTRTWVDDLSELIDQARSDGTAHEDTDARASAERLTALIEGLSNRWLSGSTPLGRAQDLVRQAVSLELDSKR
ncbi:TetR/AcrR family transcriptional regulator [Actinomadura barringtoniae]|uniref:TetR/AcrR family transcriptional regulator n=1 Tax=Actinomadura barringtoniae TaxID=1427535 RepID=A0A939T7X7_9ACTN|nr:TetR/AcrR family transcriptional regulator [Actinomadura barringtoniae]MBO2446320.1 TetR/AcrR family transcriptional regulator [Actinomadura barringtoniae]